MEYCNYEYNVLNDDNVLIFSYDELTLSKNTVLKIIDIGQKYLHKVRMNKNVKINFKKNSSMRNVSPNTVGTFLDNYFVVINTNDIISDEILLDYNTPPFDFMSESIYDYEMKLTEDEYDILYEYTSGDYDLEEISSQMISIFENKNIRQNREYKLFRGLTFGNKNDLDNFLSNNREERTQYISSWTTNVCVAKGFAITTGNNQYGVILTNIFHPNDILIDTRIIKDSDLSLQKEIIVKPGKYNYQIYAVSNEKQLYYPNGGKIPIIKLK